MTLIVQNNSDTVIVVFHEIYGVNQHMKTVCERLSEIGYDVTCPNLLNRDESLRYEQEEVAYKSFMSMGFAQAADKARVFLKQVKSKYKVVYVVGYSVGATVAWLCGAENGLVDAFVAYYGSRIRDYLDMQPQCPSLILFPVQERSFDVEELIANLRRKDNVRVRKYDGLHGFADPQNKNYSQVASRQAYADTLQFFSGVSLSSLD